jgi:hypothetical protein
MIATTGSPQPQEHVDSLLTAAQPGRHIAHFHHHPEVLANSAFTFLEGGLRAGNSVLVIATEANAERFLQRLGQGGFHASALQQAGQLTFLDAPTLLAEVTMNELPDWPRFYRAFTSILERVRAFGRGTRIYADMAGLLWRAGQATGAIRLEELWNTLAREMPISVFCSYVMDMQSEESYAGPVEELGRTHTDIVSSEEDDRFAAALDRASRELFGITLSQMAGAVKDSERRLPSGQRTMLWVKRNLPLSTAQLAERARRYYNDDRQS